MKKLINDMMLCITTIVVVMPVLVAGLTGCSQVKTGEAGMKVRFGQIVSEKPLDEGLYFYWPWMSLVTYDCRNQKIEVEQETFTKDVQYSKVKLAVTYSLDKSKVIELHKNTGPQYAAIVLEPAIVGSLKDIFGNWEADQIMANRPKIIESIDKELSPRAASYGILIKQIQLINIDFSDDFEKAVESKQIAVQRATEAKNRTQQIEEESKQKLITAKAEAEAMEIKAKALEKNKSVLLIDFINKWNGKMPDYLSLSPSTGIVPTIDMKDLTNKQ